MRGFAVRRFDLREHVSSVLVTALGSAFGVTVLLAVGIITTALSSDDTTGSSATVAFLLAAIAWVFIAIAVYVGSVVTANTFATIIAGRTRTIALLRLIGSSAGTQRRKVAREGLMVGVVGAVLGAALGTGITAGLVAVGVAFNVLPALAYAYFAPAAVLPTAAVVLSTWLASWVGSRRVLTVSPMEATGAAQELTVEQTLARRGRNSTAIVLFAVGIGILLLGVAVGLVNPLGVLVGVVGGLLSFSGLVLGAHLVMPPMLTLVGRAFGDSAPARLAAENAVRYPERSARTTIGLVIGVTLVTMFGVALESYKSMLIAAVQDDPAYYAGIQQSFDVTIAVFTVITGFSALIAAVGMVNNLSLSVLQRTRELGLLRALGFTARQVRSMILAESAQLTVASVLIGLVLGTFYGWAGAQSVLGSMNGIGTLVPPTIPVPLFLVLIGAAAVLTVGASIAPSRRATRVSPVAALAFE